MQGFAGDASAAALVARDRAPTSGDCRLARLVNTETDRPRPGDNDDAGLAERSAV